MGEIVATGATDIEVDSRLVADGMLRVAGRMLASTGELKITLANGALQKDVVVALAAEGASHPRAAAVWAGFRLRRLDADFRTAPRRDRPPWQALCHSNPRNFADRARTGERLSALRHRTAAGAGRRIQALARCHRARRRATLQSAHFEQVVRMFEDRKAWWNTPVPKQVKPQKTDRFTPMASPAPVAAAAPAPPPMAAPMAARREAMAAADQSARSERKMKKGESDAAPQIGIALKKWEANAPYIARLKAASPDKVYAVYLDQRPDNAASSAFFLDAADILLDKGKRDLALRVLSNLAEMDLENRALLRILGYRLLQAGSKRWPFPCSEQVLRIAEEEPQSLRDLGLALAAA
ncbi:hypothetical protein LP420_02405 [Massilia sp. B-10]|nr:hypothetical protein LP420_02405 [Massilia sp. B-10]